MVSKQHPLLQLDTRCFLCAGRANQGLICEPCWHDLLTDGCCCYRCGRGLDYDGICGACLKGEHSIDTTLTLFPYRFPANQLLLSLKYRNQLMLAAEFGRKIAELLVRRGDPLPDFIVPVPLHPWRLLGRGYNQALEVSRPISHVLGVPIISRGVTRERNTLPQFRLKQEQRGKNVRGAFSVHDTVFSGPVAIVDDIVTTGHTANELARQLKSAGATKVVLWACAHAG